MRLNRRWAKSKPPGRQTILYKIMTDEIGVAIGIFASSLRAVRQFAPRETITAAALLVSLAVQAAVVQTRIVPTVLK